VSSRSTKKEKVDIDKLTKRQRMAYMQRQNMLEKREAVIDQSNKHTMNARDEDVLYSLANKKSKNEEFRMADNLLRQSERGKKRQRKEISQQQVEENKKAALHKLLSEIRRKNKQRDQKMGKGDKKEDPKESNQEEVVAQPNKMVYDPTAIKYKHNKKQSFVAFPTGLLLPQVLRQSSKDAAKRVDNKKREDTCHVCSKKERKYVCKRTKKVTCSFECYRRAQS